MKIAKLFQNGQSQAVRLPREFRFDGSEVYIRKIGTITMLLPVNNPWSGFLDSLDKFSNDYMESRDQPEQQEREDMFQ